MSVTNKGIRQAMLFAAGLGTRLKPMTDKMPKALVKISGKPLIEWTLNRLVDADFNRIVVNVHHFAPMVKEWIATHPYKKTEIIVSDESDLLLDTGGGLKKAESLFVPNVPILIHNVDILSNADLKWLYEAHSNSNNDATLLVSHRETSRYLLFDNNMRLAGWTNIKTNEVKSPYENFSLVDYTSLAFSGIHVFSPHLFAQMKDFPIKFSIIDFYLKICRDYKIRGCERRNLHLVDVGKPYALSQAEDFFRNET